MSSHDSSIDLGDDFDVVPTGSSMSASWMSFRWPVIRRVRLAVPICALLFLVSAAAPPPARALALVARVPVGVDASVLIEAPDVYVYGIDGGDTGIHAYGLADGRPRWSASTVELATETTMTYLGGRLIVSMADTDSGGEHTVAFDARTGRRLWTSDLGFAVPVVGGVLVESGPPPAGFNFPGTVPAASFQLLDARTGHVRWHLDVPVNCLTQPASEIGGAPTVLIELCPNSSRLTTVDLADGRVTASRRVNLGDPATNFQLPPADRLPVPRLVVAGATVLGTTFVGGTVLVAHANVPTPTIDAYAMSDLTQRWAGLPIAATQEISLCGAALCIGAAGDGGTAANGGTASGGGTAGGVAVDLSTGMPTGRTPTRGRPADGSLILTPVGAAVSPVTVADGTVPVVAAGVGVGVGHELSPRSAARTAMTLSRWHVTSSDPVGAATAIQILDGVAVRSCAEVAGLLACLTTADRLSIWQLPPS